MTVAPACLPDSWLWLACRQHPAASCWPAADATLVVPPAPPLLLPACRYIQSCCATSGEGLYEGLDWLSQNIANRP